LTHHDIYKDTKSAPKTAAKLGGQLKRIAPSMREYGIDIKSEHTKKGRKVVIQLIEGTNPTPPGDGKVTVNSKGDGKMPPGDGKNESTVNTLTLDAMPIDSKNGQMGDGSDGKTAFFTTFYPPLDLEKREEKEIEEGRPESIEKIPSPPSPVTQEQ